MLNTISTRYGAMQIVETDNMISRALTLYGEWAMSELDLLAQIITPGMCILDVGAFIGTHTLAFSDFTGPNGKVFSFEPRREIYTILSANVSINKLQNVTVLNMALAEKVCVMNIQSLDLTQPMNFGGQPLDLTGGQTSNTTYPIDVLTIDDMDIKKIDIIKIDVEGMERKVLDGAIKTIFRNRPIIVCECNSLDLGNNLLNFFQDKQYMIYGFMAAAYNPHNFNAIQENIFDTGTELALVLIPHEKTVETLASLVDFTLLPINNIEDLVLPLLHKPQYPYEVLAYTAPPCVRIVVASSVKIIEGRRRIRYGSFII